MNNFSQVLITIVVGVVIGLTVNFLTPILPNPQNLDLSIDKNTMRSVIIIIYNLYIMAKPYILLSIAIIIILMGEKRIEGVW